MDMWIKLHELEGNDEIIVNFDNVTYAEHNYEYTLGEPSNAVIKEKRNGACLHFGREHYVMVKEDLENIELRWDMKYGE